MEFQLNLHFLGGFHCGNSNFGLGKRLDLKKKRTKTRTLKFLPSPGKGTNLSPGIAKVGPLLPMADLVYKSNGIYNYSIPGFITNNHHCGAPPHIWFAKGYTDIILIHSIELHLGRLENRKIGNICPCVCVVSVCLYIGVVFISDLFQLQ